MVLNYVSQGLCSLTNNTNEYDQEMSLSNTIDQPNGALLSSQNDDISSGGSRSKISLSLWCSVYSKRQSLGPVSQLKNYHVII